METTFIAIHDLSRDARIRYVSDSVEDVLGYRPQEVVNRTSWEYFHPDEIPFAKAVYGRGIRLDKAAVLKYCRIRHHDGTWVGCECVFTVVYDVLVSCVSIYRRGNKSEKRANDAPIIRRIFSSSPRDPRYHMLSYLSNKFVRPAAELSPEPRAALFLNRFTRTAPVMFATNGVEEVLSLTPGQLMTKSFYYCISADCLGDAVRCIESAKANDSIAYLRFRYRNPLLPDPEANEDMPMAEPSSSEDDDDDGGVNLDINDDVSMQGASVRSPSDSPGQGGTASDEVHHSNTGDSTEIATSSNEADFDQQPPPQYTESPTSSDTAQNGRQHGLPAPSPPVARLENAHLDNDGNDGQEQEQPEEIEIEAVVSCTSDGLVVILRKAHAIIPDPTAPADSEATRYSRGVFASPWATNPVFAGPAPPPAPAAAHAAAPPPHYQPVQPPTPTTVHSASTQPSTNVWSAIRDVAVFAWSLTGINGSIVDHGEGTPTGEALPPAGIPIWNPDATPAQGANDAYNGFADNSHRRVDHGWLHRGDSGISGMGGSSSERSNSGGDRMELDATNNPTSTRPNLVPSASYNNNNNTNNGSNTSSSARVSSPEKTTTSGSGSNNSGSGAHSSSAASAASLSDEEILWRRAPFMPPWRPSASTRARRGRGSGGGGGGTGNGSGGPTGSNNRVGRRQPRRRRISRDENGAGSVGAGAGANGDVGQNGNHNGGSTTTTTRARDGHHHPYL